MKIAELARICGIHRNTVAKWVRTGRLDRDRLRKLRMRDIVLLERKAAFLPGYSLTGTGFLAVAPSRLGERETGLLEPWERSVLMALRRRRNRLLAKWKPFVRRRHELQALVRCLTNDLRHGLKYLPQVAYLTYLYFLCSCLSTIDKEVPELFGYDHRNPPHVWAEALAAYDLYLSSLPPRSRPSAEDQEKQREQLRSLESRARPARAESFTLSEEQLEFLGGVERLTPALVDNWLYELSRRDPDSPWPRISKTDLRDVQTELMWPYREGRAPVFLSILRHIGLRRAGASWQEVAESARVSRRTLYEYRKRYPLLEGLLDLPKREPPAMPRDSRARRGQTRAELARGETGQDS